MRGESEIRRDYLGIKAGGRSYMNERMLIGDPTSYESEICRDCAAGRRQKKKRKEKEKEKK